MRNPVPGDSDRLSAGLSSFLLRDTSLTKAHRIAAPTAAGKQPCGVTRVLRDLAPECHSCSLSTILTDLDRSAASLGRARGVSRVLSASRMTLPLRSARGSMMTEMLLDHEASHRLAAICFRI